MVTSIKLKGMYNVGVSSSKNIKIADNKVSLKDIPFVRYDLGYYGEVEAKYIKDMMEKFSLSTHLVQFNIKAGILEEMASISSLFDKVAKYVYLDITNDDVVNGCLNTDSVSILSEVLATYTVDRIMLVDKTTTLDMANAKKIMGTLAKTVKVRGDMIGICSSPLCMTDELACLTAIKARALAALYNSSNDVAVPSANHQCMNCCGCIRFFDITSDIEAPVSTKKAASTDKKEKAPKKETTKEKRTTKKVSKGDRIYSISNFI